MKRSRLWKARIKKTNNKKKMREKSWEIRKSPNEEDFKAKPMTI